MTNKNIEEKVREHYNIGDDCQVDVEFLYALNPIECAYEVKDYEEHSSGVTCRISEVIEYKHKIKSIKMIDIVEY